MTSKPKTLNFEDEKQTMTDAVISEGRRTRLRTVAQMLKMPEYAWATNSYLRHVIFEAEDRVGSGCATVPGNGLAPAIVRIGRKVLIDLVEFDRWVEGHRMRRGAPSLQDASNATQVSGG